MKADDVGSNMKQVLEVTKNLCGNSAHKPKILVQSPEAIHKLCIYMHPC